MTRMREVRKKAKLTMKELGQIVGVSESTISLYETGKREPDHRTLVLLASALHVTTDYLLGITEDGEAVLENKKAPDDGGQRMDRIREQIVMALGQVDDHEAAMVYGYIQALREKRKDREVPNQ